jgi:hypothetical protein
MYTYTHTYIYIGAGIAQLFLGLTKRRIFFPPFQFFFFVKRKNKKMKFGKYLLAMRIQGWEEYYVDYKALQRYVLHAHRKHY